MAESTDPSLHPGNLAEGLRWTMRHAAMGVALITTRDAAGGYHGLAVTTANSLSMEPPSMMFAVNRTASAAPALAESGTFCINILGAGHEPILSLFSRSDTRAERFSSPLWQEGAMGLPWLKGSLSSIFCVRDAVHEYGSHLVYFGRIVDILHAQADAPPAPLLWRQGAVMPLAS